MRRAKAMRVCSNHIKRKLTKPEKDGNFCETFCSLSDSNAKRKIRPKSVEPVVKFW